VTGSASSEKEARAAQYSKYNREFDPFKMDRERQAHLTVKAAADQEISSSGDARCRPAVPSGRANGGRRARSSMATIAERWTPETWPMLANGGEGMVNRQTKSPAKACGAQ
jgi:hypothetical protein